MAYPSFLPVPTRNSYAGQPGVDAKRFEMDDNQYAQMRVGNRNPFVYTLSWSLSYLQARLFQGWFTYDIDQGTIEFEIPIGTVTVKVKCVDGQPTWTPNGNGWVVQMNVREMKTAPTMPTSSTLPQWPSTLPAFESNGFSFQTLDPFVVPDIMNGTPEQRIRFRDKRSQYNGTLILDPSQRPIFWEFWQNQLLNGQRWFNAPIATPEIQTQWRARIATTPTEGSNASWFNLQMTLEAIRVPVIGYLDYIAFQPPTSWVEAGYFDTGYVN